MVLYVVTITMQVHLFFLGKPWFMSIPSRTCCTVGKEEPEIFPKYIGEFHCGLHNYTSGITSQLTSECQGPTCSKKRSKHRSKYRNSEVWSREVPKRLERLVVKLATSAINTDYTWLLLNQVSVAEISRRLMMTISIKGNQLRVMQWHLRTGREQCAALF